MIPLLLSSAITSPPSPPRTRRPALLVHASFPLTNNYYPSENHMETYNTKAKRALAANLPPPPPLLNNSAARHLQDHNLWPQLHEAVSSHHQPQSETHLRRLFLSNPHPPRIRTSPTQNAPSNSRVTTRWEHRDDDLPDGSTLSGNLSLVEDPSEDDYTLRYLTLYGRM